MTLSDFKAMLVDIDPNLDKWKSSQTGNYTVWTLGQSLAGVMSDDAPDEEDDRVHVERFTKSDTDSIAPAIKAALEAAFIPYEYVRIFEEDTGYIHHSFTCIVG